MRLLSLTIITAAALGLADPGGSAVAHEAAASSPFSQALQWRLVGPFRGGRVTAVAGHADEPNVYYMGAAGGGVWKTEDAGQTWQNVSDGFLQVGTIGAIAVAPSNPDIVYVGTGEAPIRGVATARGDGVYRSDNDGKTWRRVGLEKSRHISKIIVDPTNPELVYVAVQGDAWGPSEQRGVYRSRDGGKKLGEDPLREPEHRRQRSRHGPAQFEHSLCGHVGPRAAAVDDPQRRTGKRPVEICRRRHPLDEADPGPSIADRQDRDYCLAGRPEPRLGDDRGCGRRRLPLG